MGTTQYTGSIQYTLPAAYATLQAMTERPIFSVGKPKEPAVDVEAEVQKRVRAIVDEIYEMYLGALEAKLAEATQEIAQLRDRVTQLEQGGSPAIQQTAVWWQPNTTQWAPSSIGQGISQPIGQITYGLPTSQPISNSAITTSVKQ